MSDDDYRALITDEGWDRHLGILHSAACSSCGAPTPASELLPAVPHACMDEELPEGAYWLWCRLCVEAFREMQAQMVLRLLRGDPELRDDLISTVANALLWGDIEESKQERGVEALKRFIDFDEAERANEGGAAGS